MAANPLFGDSAKPTRAAHLGLGMVSPLWLPFMAVAGMGAAMWALQNWPRMMHGFAGGVRPGATPETPAPEPTNLQPAADTAEPFVTALEPGVAKGFAPAVLTESLAVQGEDDSDTAPHEAFSPEAAGDPVIETPVATAAEPLSIEPMAKASRRKSARVEGARAEDAHTDDAHTDDYKPEPTLPPHEGLPARRKGGGKKRQAI